MSQKDKLIEDKKPFLESVHWKVSGGLIFYNQIMSYIKSKENFFDEKNKPLVSAFYDSHQGLTWNGGRGGVPFSWPIDESVRRIKSYNELGISFYVAFNNILLEEEHLNDENSNYFLDQIATNPLNGVIVASDILKNYIRKRHPKIKIVASICFCKKDISEYERMLADYDIVALHPDLNRDIDFIMQIKESDRARIEVLVNEFCIYDCKYRKKHYEMISETNINQSYTRKHESADYCFVEKEKREMHQKTIEDSCGKDESVLCLRKEELLFLNSLGIKNFKIMGRDVSDNFIIDNIEKYIDNFSSN